MTDNPAKIHTFDHASVARLPEYQDAARALDRLSEAINRADVPITQAAWLRLVRDLAASLPFMDATSPDTCTPCRRVLDLYAPAAVTIDGGVHATYRCAHGRTWTCWWSLSAPHW